MPIFRAEIAEKVEFSLIRFYFLSPVKFYVILRPKGKKHGVLLYFFTFLFQKKKPKLGIMGKAYSLPSCPDQLAVSFWILDPVTYHVLLYPE